MSLNTWHIASDNTVKYKTENGNTFEVIGKAFTPTNSGYYLDIEMKQFQSPGSSDDVFNNDAAAAVIAASNPGANAEIARMLATTYETRDSQTSPSA
jgi:hypothetical protein